MKISSSTAGVADLQCDAIVTGIHADLTMDTALKQIDEAVGGQIAQLVDREEISGKSAEVTRLLAPRGLSARQLLIVGLGEREQFGPAVAGHAVGAAAKQLAAKPRKKVVFNLGADWDDQLIANSLCTAMAACQGQDLYRAEKKLTPPEEIVWIGASNETLAEAEILGESVNVTRRLVNESPSVMSPIRLAEEASELARQYGLEIDVWDAARLREERCEALLAVARGSTNPPRLVTLKYRGGSEASELLGLVGKGVTFDSGGYSLKPSDAMQGMKSDMAGAATVLGAMTAIARLQLPVSVNGYLGLVENMISGDSYKVGDVVTARSGKTIEVRNTDAEGRLVLADTLDVALEHGAARLVDVATLTGACLVALGNDVTGLMTNQQSWCDELVAAGRTTGEPLWQLPMFKHYDEQISSEVADIKNTGEDRWGGAITAAKLLEHFVKERPWIHCDIAGPAFAEKPKAWRDAGATGAMVRTLVQLARQLSRR
ncbi:MAG: leucyl aminopeptidase [Planctomycetota bacterium]